MNASGALFISFFIPGVARDKVKVIIETTFANRFFLNVTPEQSLHCRLQPFFDSGTGVAYTVEVMLNYRAMLSDYTPFQAKRPVTLDDDILYLKRYKNPGTGRP
jgi:hypothetical protein